MFFYFAISFNSFSQSGWHILNSGTSSYLSAVFFNDSLTGYTGGQNGYLAKTTNGGLNWLVLNSGFSGFIREIEFLDYNTGYFCGDNGTIKRTTNAGINWISLNSGVNITVQSLSAPAQNLLYLCTNSGTVLKSTDSGISFLTFNVSTNSLLAIDFYSSDTGYVSGQGGVAYKTYNGGLNWQSINLSTVNNSWGLHCISNNFVFFSANYGTIRKTTDGGVTVTSSFAEGANLNTIFFPTKIIGYAGASGGVIIKTVNGGLNWQVMNTGISSSVEDLSFINAKTGYAVGGNGLILKTVDGGDGFELKVLVPKGREIWTSGSNRIISWSNAFIGNIKIEYSVNNGSTWNLIANSIPADSNHFNWFVNSGLSNECKVKVSSISNPNIFALNDGTFRINPDIYAWLYSPEMLYYKFNSGINSTPNYAISQYGIGEAQIMGHTLGNGGMYDSTLIGGGGTGSDHFVNTKWAASLPITGWSIGFWVSNISLGSNPSNAVYLFGDVTANNFRCYYGGSGGIGSTDTAIMLRCLGMSDVRIPVVKGLSYYIHIVFDPSVSAIKVYKNGILSLTVPQGNFLILGNGPFLIGAHSTFASSLSQNMKLDEFRIYDRVLSSSEILQTWHWTLPYFMTSIKKISEEIPESFLLKQNYPNPFNPSTKIEFCISKPGFTVIKVFNIIGQEVTTLVSENLKEGKYFVDFNAGNLSGGIYFYRIFSGEFSDVKKLLLLK